MDKDMKEKNILKKIENIYLKENIQMAKKMEKGKNVLKMVN